MGFQTWTGRAIFYDQSSIDEPEDYQDMNIEPTDQAVKPKLVRGPKQPSATERALHELTHLPFRSWCEVCVRAKSKQNQHRPQRRRGPVIQIDFAFWSNEEGVQTTIITGLDIQTGIGMAIMVETKEYTNYATTEVKKFVYEVGRSYGHIQCDKEKAIIAIAKAVVREIGGLRFRTSPK